MESANKGQFATLIAKVPSEHHQTLYLRWGDWSVWVAVALLVWTLTRLIAR